MSMSTESNGLSRPELLVLARLSGGKKPASESTIAETLAKFGTPARTKGEWTPRVSELVHGLVSRQLITPTRALTATGEAALRHAFGGSKTPDWRTITRRIPALTLGLEPTIRFDHKKTIQAAVAGHGLGLPGHKSLTALLDEVVAAELGLPPGRVTMDRIRAHLLARRAKIEPKGAAKDIVNRIAGSVVRAPGTAAALQDGLTRQWLAGDPLPPPAPRQTAIAYAPSPAPPDEGSFASLVKDVAHDVGPDGRFGSQKVFISAIWDQLHDRVDITLDELKQRLLDANRHGLLSLARADLVGAMDPSIVARSEIADANASFHFVIDAGRR
jgi:hypothetical protein